jgi:hypothetical protein
MLAVGMDRKDSGRAWLTTKLAHQTFELSNAVAIPRALVNIWVISRNEEDGLERVVKEGRGRRTDLMLGSSISYTQRPVCRGRKVSEKFGVEMTTEGNHQAELDAALTRALAVTLR